MLTVRRDRPALTAVMRRTIPLVLICILITILWRWTDGDSRWHPSNLLSSSSKQSAQNEGFDASDSKPTEYYKPGRPEEQHWETPGAGGTKVQHTRPSLAVVENEKEAVEHKLWTSVVQETAKPSVGIDTQTSDTKGIPEQNVTPTAQESDSFNHTASATGAELITTSPFPPLPPADIDEYMSICMLVKNQSIDLPEFFIHHYHHHGIRKFYIVDDGTEPPLSTVEDYGIPKSAIEFVYEPPHPHDLTAIYRTGFQESSYTKCLQMFGHRHTWMGFLDPDEFIEMTGGETLMEFLQDWDKNETVGAVGINWLLHSSAGLLTRPEEDSRKAYNRCIIDNPENDNQATKSFVKTALIDSVAFPHCMSNTLKNDTIQVGEHGDQIWVPCSRTPITRDRIGLHHFATKSRAEFLQKQERGHIIGGIPTDDWWHQVEDEVQWDCLNLTRYVP